MIIPSLVAIPLCDLPRPETFALLTRYPDWTMGGLLRFADYFGTAVFALTGVVTAGRRGMDFLGCVIVVGRCADAAALTG